MSDKTKLVRVKQLMFLEGLNLRIEGEPWVGLSFGTEEHTFEFAIKTEDAKALILATLHVLDAQGDPVSQAVLAFLRQILPEPEDGKCP